MRYAMWSPLPPQRSGIADYSYELLGPLAELAEVAVAARQPETTRVPAGVPVLDPDTAHAELNIYHLGNHAGVVSGTALVSPAGPPGPPASSVSLLPVPPPLSIAQHRTVRVCPTRTPLPRARRPQGRCSSAIRGTTSSAGAPPASRPPPCCGDRSGGLIWRT